MSVARVIVFLTVCLKLRLCFQSRVVELKQSLTELMLKYVHRKYFQSDIAAFSTLISLNILVSTEKLSRKAMEQFLATEDFQVSRHILLLQKLNWQHCGSVYVYLMRMKKLRIIF